MSEFREVSILIADDEEEIIESLEELIQMNAEQLGIVISSISKASDGSLALSKLRNQEYDILILDNQMPKKTGLDVARSLSVTNNKNTHIIFLSGNLDQEVVLELNQLKVTDIIAKPYDISRIMKSILTVAKH